MTSENAVATLIVPGTILLKDKPPDINNDRESKNAKTSDVDMDEATVGSQEAGGKPSYKDKILANQPQEMEIKMEEENDIEIEGDDVIIDPEGSVPSINFSKRIHKEINSSIKQTVMVHLFARGLGYKGLEMAIKILWKPKGGYQVMDLENNYYIVQFAVRSDYLWVLPDGPWVVKETYLTIQPWSPNFSIKQTRISALTVWVRLPGLPFRYYHKNVIRAIGGVLGNVLKIDYNTNLGGRG